jgi:hypothetical protein
VFFAILFFISFSLAFTLISIVRFVDAKDCDMPTGLSVPDARPEAGVDHVDVMKFLGLKRAEALKKQTGGGNTTQGGDNNNSNPSTSTASAP